VESKEPDFTVITEQEKAGPIYMRKCVFS